MMDRPMMLCIIFFLGARGQILPPAVPLWPPEGGVQVGHSGAAVSSAHPGAQWSRGNRAGLDAEVLD